MKRTYLSNAFSLQMLGDLEPNITITSINSEEIPEDVVSCIGHADTANVLSGILGKNIEMNRSSINIEVGDILYVAQLQGGRLPEGCTTLPEGYRFKFYKMTFSHLDKKCLNCPMLGGPCFPNCTAII